jgi:hypothetical protein
MASHIDIEIMGNSGGILGVSMACGRHGVGMQSAYGRLADGMQSA